MSGKNRFDLHETRLATTDEHGNRVYIHPEDIKGKWKTNRTLFYWILISFYLLLPWIYINGKQLVLLDIPKREFYLFGVTFFGHDGPILFFLGLGFIFTMAFVTAIWGRVWCGWACPQTVFIDAIYRKIERLIEGKSRQRKKLDQQKMNLEKFFKKSLKWFLFTLVTLHIVHSFLGYFVGTHKLFFITTSSPSENWTLFTIMVSLTSFLLFNFGWFREQFCIIACPYGRIQSVFMDESSLIVGYDTKRGEPARAKDVPKEEEGDCINCHRCVKACPTGIDIRRGTQLECIACTMCIDACDEIMTKLKKPKGLIRYTSENELNGKVNKIGPRHFIYVSIFIILVIGLTYSLALRKEIDAHVLRASHVPFNIITKSDGQKQIVNHFKLKFNQFTENDKFISVQLDPKLQKEIEVIVPNSPINIKGVNISTNIFFKFSKSILKNGSKKVQLYLYEEGVKDPVKTIEVKLVGPFT